MPTFHHKLVRDRIPELIRASGKICQIETLSVLDYQQALRQKLIEEAQEVAETVSIEQLIQEIADVREVLDALVEAYQISEADVYQIQHQKRRDRGGFQERTQLIWSDEPSSESA